MGKNYYIFSGLSIGGVETFSINIALQLSQKNQVYFLEENASSDNNEAREILKKGGVNIIEKEVVFSENKFNADAVFVIPFYATGFLEEFFKKVIQFKTLPILLGFVHNDGAYYYDNVFKYAGITSKFICVSHTIENKVKELLNHKEDKIQLKKCPLVIQSSSIINSNKSLNLIFVGRIINETKGVFKLVDICNTLVKENIDFKLKIIGEGPDLTKLKELLAPFNKDEKIHFITGANSPHQVQRYYEESDILLILSYFEGGPLVLYEAMECGVVPVGFNVGVMSKVIELNKSGFYFAHDEFDLLNKKLVELSQIQLINIKKEARNRIRSLEIGMMDYISFLENILINTSLPPVHTGINEVNAKIRWRKTDLKTWIIKIIGLPEYKRNYIQNYVFDSQPEGNKTKEIEKDNQLQEIINHYHLVYENMPIWWKKVGALNRKLRK